MNKIISLVLKTFERQNLSMIKKIENLEFEQVLKFWSQTQNSPGYFKIDKKLLSLRSNKGARIGGLWALTDEIKQVQ